MIEEERVSLRCYNVIVMTSIYIYVESVLQFILFKKKTLFSLIVVIN